MDNSTGPLFNLNLRSLVRGLVMAVMSAVFDFAYQYVVIEKTFAIDYHQLALVVGGTVFTYLSLQFGTGTGGRMLTNAPYDAAPAAPFQPPTHDAESMKTRAENIPEGK